VRLQVLGIEVVQAVQRFSLDDREWNNSVPLVARKRTMVRVYIDSGMPDEVIKKPATDRDEGAVDVPLGNLANVTGTLKVSRAFGPSPSVQPINPGEVMTARPRAWILREQLDHTLNFVLPAEDLTGRIRLEVEAHLKGGILRILFRARASTVVEFHERRLPKKLGHVLINHSAAPAPPTMAYYYYCLDQVIAMYPAPDADFFPLYHLPGFETIETDADLHTDQGWGELLDQLRQIKQGFNLDGLLLTALYPPTYAQGTGSLPVAGHGEFAAVFSEPNVFAHELGHLFDLNHAADGNPDQEGDEDPRIPSNSTDELGLDMGKRVLLPVGSIEMMCYMEGVPTWISTNTWQALFDQFIP
jgi:hypothetical protein